MALDRAAPLLPNPNPKIKVQQVRRWSRLVIPVLTINGNTLFWACKNLNWHWRRPRGRILGINQRQYIPDSNENWGSCLRVVKICSVKAHRIAIGRLANVRTSIALCMYTPSMWFCFAPYACPQKVSSALPIPSY